MKSVREVVLEHENARLKSKLAYYEAFSPSTAVPTFMDEAVKEIELPNLTANLRLATHWDVSRADLGLKVIGRASEKDSFGFKIGYYVSDHEVLSAFDQLTALGALHERVIQQLAAEYRKLT